MRKKSLIRTAKLILETQKFISYVLWVLFLVRVADLNPAGLAGLDEPPPKHHRETCFNLNDHRIKFSHNHNLHPTFSSPISTQSPHHQPTAEQIIQHCDRYKARYKPPTSGIALQ
jgi:hypothetical protein